MKVSRRVNAALAIAVATTFAVSGCTRGATPAPTASPIALTAANCAADATSENTLKVGAILPLTGPAHLGGAAQLAAINLALANIKDAGGVTGKPVCLVALDSGTGLDAAGGSASGASLAGQKVSVILTSLTTEGTRGVIEATANTSIPVVSLTSTSSTLTVLSDNYYRVAPPEWAQAAAMTQTLIVDGNPKIAIIGSTDPASIAFRAQLTTVFTDEKGLVLYGAVGGPIVVPSATPTPTPKPSTTPVPEAFTPGQTDFTAQVAAALATKPNAVVVVATTETPLILAELIRQGWKMPKTYLSDSNVVSYSGLFANGTLLGAQGTIPGQSPSQELQRELTAWTTQVRASALKSVNYAAEAYDATMLVALAAARYARTDPRSISLNMLAVSGTYGGEKCDEYASCARILDKNQMITFRGPSSMGVFTATHEVSSAMVSIFQYNSENIPIWTGVQSVRSIKEPKR